MSTTTFLRFLRFFIESLFWNRDWGMRLLLWASAANALINFTPLHDSLWLILLPMAVIVSTGIYLIRSLRQLKRQQAAFVSLEKQGGHWAGEMGSALKLLLEAEARFAPSAELDELGRRFNEARVRFEREIEQYHKESQ